MQVLCTRMRPSFSPFDPSVPPVGACASARRGYRQRNSSAPQFDGYDEEGTPGQLSDDIAQWQPRLDATPLEDDYSLLPVPTVHFAPVSAEFDINDEECRRVVK